MRRGSGFQLPRVDSVAAKMAIGLVVASVASQLVPGLAEWLVLLPGMVFRRFALWQPLTYGFVALDPLGVIFGALITWQMGGALEAVWGARRMAAFALGITALSALLTLVVAVLYPPLQQMPFAGEWVLVTALWVGFGLYIGRGQTNFWGIPTSGNMLALIGAGFVILNLIFSHTLVHPALFAVLLTVAYMRGYSPRTLWLRLQSWRFQRQLRGRSKHLRVIGGKDANTSRGSDRYLH